MSEQKISGHGEDTNQALLASALGALSANSRDADLLIVSGDLLAHRFEEIAAQVLGTTQDSGTIQELPPRPRSMSPMHCVRRCPAGLFLWL